jgi:hypothetical protein
MLEVPPGGVLLAGSATAPVEMWASPSGNVLAVQASPASSDASHGLLWQRWRPLVPNRSRFPVLCSCLQGHAELSAEETLEKIHSAVTAAGRLSAGAQCASAKERPHSIFDVHRSYTLPKHRVDKLAIAVRLLLALPTYLQRGRRRALAACGRTPQTPSWCCSCTGSLWSAACPRLRL